MKLKLTLTAIDGSTYSFLSCRSFFFSKEAYTPYTYFEGTFITGITDTQNIKEIKFWAGEQLIHHGLVDSIEVGKAKNTGFIKIKSKNFTSLLCQNQTTPGMRPGANFQTIMSEITVPNVSYETTSTLNYIYIREGSTLWDTAANFNFRLNGKYPYIEGTNTVRVTDKIPVERNLSESAAVKTGVLYDYTKIISNLHMKNTEGTYNSYNGSSQFAIERKIIRHKHIPLDMQYLSDPDSGLLFKLNYSRRGCRCLYVQYNGYMGEDLNDTLTFGSIQNKRIKKIELTGGNGKVKTFLGVYDDAFS